MVDIHDKNGLWVARGFYNGHSRIAARVLTEDPDEAVDEAFFARKIHAAVALRRNVLRLDEVSDAWRVVHSEGDGLSANADRVENCDAVRSGMAQIESEREILVR